MRRVVGITDTGVDVGAPADLKMEVGRIGSKGGAYCADLIAALHGLIGGDEAFVQMGVNGLDDLGGAIGLCDAVGDDDHVPPAIARYAAIDDASCTSGIDGIAQVGVHAADTVEVIAKMPGDAEGLGVVGQRAMF